MTKFQNSLDYTLESFFNVEVHPHDINASTALILAHFTLLAAVFGL